MVAVGGVGEDVAGEGGVAEVPRYLSLLLKSWMQNWTVTTSRCVGLE